MSLFERLVMNSVCRSNHHRLAVEALRLMKGEKADLWRNLFLHHHASYLEGAKAPDEVFKDYKNHVLHVRENDWGGAPAAAREWYRRTVRALGNKDWSHAAYCAGVMSHYVVDPIQPFHTGQTEEEGVIHRAVEWSFSKSYFDLTRILHADFGGFPDLPVPAGPDWLEQMVRTGAKTANPHYETIINHYNFEAGVKNPRAGLDQEIKDAIAKLIGHAAATLARVLERAVAEAKIAPPKVNLALDTLIAVMGVPMRAVLAKIADVGERAIVAAMYREFRKTGKVRSTMAEDDKTVRALHAEEVLKRPLSSLDAQWPREIGTAHGTGAVARNTRRVKAKRPEKPKAQPAAAKVAATPAKPAPAPAVKSKGLFASAMSAAKAMAPGGANSRFRLTEESPIEEAPSIGPKTATRLTAIGIHTVKDLLSVSPDGAAAQIKFRHISANLIRDWQAQAELACTVPGLSSLGVQLIVASGVRDAEDLAGIETDALLNMIEEFCETPDGVRILRDAPVPSREQVEKWIASARNIAQQRAA
jgi:predicted flap endonuclease-1-like 5' DNA nuclease